MDSAAPVILKVIIPKYKYVTVEASNGKRYYSDLAALSKVYCFPKSEEDWKKISIDSAGLALIWTTRFEVHIDQIIGLATKVEDMAQPTG